MGIEFDAAELDRVFVAELIRGEKVNMPYPLRYKAALLAVAAHVREQTLNEAIKELERLAEESIDTPDVYDCETRLRNFAADTKKEGAT